MSNLEILIPAANENDSMKAIAERYKAIGLSPHGIPSQSKAPTVAWQTGDWSHTVEEGKNIGCRIDGLVDIDVDYHPGGPFMGILAPTAFVFGRDSAKATHYLYEVDGAATSKTFTVTDGFAEKCNLVKPNGKPKKMILEIRTGSSHQTVFPPSIHETGEAVRFETVNGRTYNGDPSIISFQELKRCAAIAAIACVFLIMWKNAGSRHEAALNAAGVLRRYFHATEKESIKILLNGVILCDGDEEPKDRERAIRDAYKVDIKKAAGWAGLKKTFGLEDADVRQFALWAKPDAPNIDFDEAAHLRKTYHIVTQGGRTGFHRKRINHDTGCVEWVEQSLNDVRIENRLSPAVTAFLKDPDVPRYMNGFHFDPTTTDSKPGAINKWNGWAIEPVDGDWSTIKNHMFEVLADSDTENYKYIFKWFAFYVQHPDKRAEVALVFRGALGTGKGKFVVPMGNLAPKSFRHVSSKDEVVGKFNAHLHECILFFVDEGFWAGDKKAEGPLKRMITEPTLSIEGKFKDSVPAKNLLHIVMASNENWVVPDSIGGRRYAVFDVSPKYKKNFEYFSKLIAAMGDEHGNIGNEMAAFFHALKTADILDWHPRVNIPQTKALKEQKIASEAGSPIGVLRKWFEQGFLPGTHEGSVSMSANRLVFEYAWRDCKNEYTSRSLGETLKKFAVKKRVWLYGRSEIDGEIKKKQQAVVYDFRPLAEVRQELDPDGDWNAVTEWSFQMSSDATPPQMPGDDEMVLMRHEDEPEVPF